MEMSTNEGNNNNNEVGGDGDGPSPSVMISTSSASALKVDNSDLQNGNLESGTFHRLHTSLLEYGPGINETSELYENLSLISNENDSAASTLNFSRVDSQILEFKEAIVKRDEIIKNLVNSHEMLQNQIAEKDEELRKTEAVADELEKLKETLQEFVENSEVLRNQSVPFGDISSYLNLPNIPEGTLNINKIITKSVSTQSLETPESEHSSPVPHCISPQEIEDLKLQVSDLENKLEIKNKYLNELTIDRESERDEYHNEKFVLEKKLAEVVTENAKLEEINAQQKLELNDYEIRLKDADQVEQELIQKSGKSDDEMKIAVEKVLQLREIIRDLEQQIESASANAVELKDQNQFLTEELDRLENKLKEHDELQITQDTITSGADMTIDEIQVQINDLTSKLERKLLEMDNFPWSTRPNSSCSSTQYLSSEDVSVRDNSRTIQAATPYLIAEGLCRLEGHFESLLRFEDIIMKRVSDSDLRYLNTKKRQEELENEKLALQETMKEQILKISDLQSRLDQFRFEPSPNAVTLTGLRARVQFLTEQVENYKGQLELKLIENQDVEHKLASTQALLAKYTAQLHQPATVRKSSVHVQTDASSQTDSANQKQYVHLQNPSQAQAVRQTNWFDINHPLDSLEISTIQGEPPPTHSTPNDPLADLSRRKKTVSWRTDIDLERDSPEVLRFRERESEQPPHSSSTKVCTNTNANYEEDLFETNGTLIELRSRVKFLEEQVDEYKGQLKFKLIEHQDVEKKLISTQALLSTTSEELQKLKNVKKASALVQTSVSTKDIQVQTIEDNDLSCRVELLDQQVKEYERQIQLKFVEKQDVAQQLASSQALVSKYSAQLEQLTNLKKVSTIVQTDPPLAIQTREVQIQVNDDTLKMLHGRVQFLENQIEDLNEQVRFQQIDSQHLEDKLAQTETLLADAVDQLEKVNGVRKSTVFVQTDVLQNPPCIKDIPKKPYISRASIELYLRTKSHRKALCWQKKYLLIVIHGYKDLLCDIGAGFEHPDYFQKELPVVPTSIGLINPKSPITRFRIIAKVVIVTTRMKYMVRRWDNKVPHSSSGGSVGSKENSPPPSPSLDNAIKPTIAGAAGYNKIDHRNVLTQYLERFQNLENEIGQTIVTRPRTLHK